MTCNPSVYEPRPLLTRTKYTRNQNYLFEYLRTMVPENKNSMLACCTAIYLLFLMCYTFTIKFFCSELNRNW